MAVASGNGQYAEEGDNCCCLFSLIGIILIFQTFTNVLMVLIVLTGIAVMVGIVIGSVYLIIKMIDRAERSKDDRRDT